MRISLLIILLSLWKQLYHVFCGSRGAFQKSEKIAPVISSGLSQFWLGDYRILIESLQDIDVYLAGRAIKLHCRIRCWLILGTKSQDIALLLHQFWPLKEKKCIAGKSPNVMEALEFPCQVWMVPTFKNIIFNFIHLMMRELRNFLGTFKLAIKLSIKSDNLI